MNKGQGVIEFTMLIGIIVFFFIAVLFVVQDSVRQQDYEQQRVYAQDLALRVQNEIALAHEAPSGYMRNFSLPPNLLGTPYTINITEDVVYLRSDRIGLAYEVLAVNGSLVQGENTIRKTGEEVQLNA